MSKKQKWIRFIKAGIICCWDIVLILIWIFCVKNMVVLILDILLTVILASVVAKIYVNFKKIGVKKKEQSQKDGDQLVKKKLFLLIPLCCSLIILLIFINLVISFGSSVEDAYRRKFYYFKENELNILYQQKIENDELVILSEDSEIAYCLFEKFDLGNDTYYRIRKIYTINKEFLNPDFERQVKIMGKTEEDERFLKESNEESQISNLVDLFYKKDKIFFQDDFQIIGVSYNSFVDQIRLAGQNIHIIKILKLDGKPIYLWKADPVDLEKVDFFNIKIN